MKAEKFFLSALTPTPVKPPQTDVVLSSSHALTHRSHIRSLGDTPSVSVQISHVFKKVEEIITQCTAKKLRHQLLRNIMIKLQHDEQKTGLSTSTSRHYWL